MKVKDLIGDNSIWMPGKDYYVNKPMLSIIMPTYGRGKNGFFKRAVESFINQTLKDTELIIIDDQNEDGTEKQIEELMQQDGRISCIRHVYNIGLPAVSGYEAYMKSKGEYIGFLFDDCVLFPTAYERSLSAMKNRNALVSYGRCFSHTDINNMHKGAWVYYNESMLENLEFNNYLGNLTMICHKSVFESIGWYDPHITMLRICDWDMWVRIKRAYELIDTGVKFGEEFGITQKSSLGNSAIIDHQSIVEHMKHSGFIEKCLSLENFENYDILSVHDNASKHFRISLDSQLERFRSKKWYTGSNYEIDIDSSAPFVQDYINVIEFPGDCISASTALAFNDTFAGTNSVFSYLPYYNLLPQARALVLSRLIVNDAEILRKAKAIGLPVFLYWDDNFIQLAKTNQQLAFFTESYAREFFRNFDGIILTNKKFIEEFKKAKYHKNIFLSELSYSKQLEKPIERRSMTGYVNIYFIGGLWRTDKFTQYVIPALNELAENYQVAFFCPDYQELKSAIKKSKISFPVTYVDFTYSFEQMIHKYGKHGMHIQVHTSAENPNNIYKTKNSLLTSALLGAALVSSDEAPYNMLEKDEEMPYFLAGDSISSWYDILEELIVNESMRLDTVTRARNYCANRYDRSPINKFVEYVLDNTKKVDYLTYLDRVAKLARFESSQSAAASSVAPHGAPQAPLVASKRIGSSIRYKFNSKVESFSEVTVIFGTHFQCPEGNVDVKISSPDGRVIRRTSLSLNSVNDNFKYVMHFEPIENAEGKEYNIEFSFRYNNGTKPISLYERNDLYPDNKIFQKLARAVGKTGSLYIELT